MIVFLFTLLNSSPTTSESIKLFNIFMRSEVDDVSWVDSALFVALSMAIELVEVDAWRTSMTDDVIAGVGLIVDVTLIIEVVLSTILYFVEGATILSNGEGVLARILLGVQLP